MGDVVLTDAAIMQLITCEKTFATKPREAVKVNKNFQQKFVVQSADGVHQFTVFVAWSAFQPQDFSVGLMYGDNLLFRVNGFHGLTRAGYHSADHHAVPHTHTLTMKDIANGRQNKPSKTIDVSGEYVDLVSARLYFFKCCGIIGHEEYFSSDKQITIDDL